MLRIAPNTLGPSQTNKKVKTKDNRENHKVMEGGKDREPDREYVFGSAQRRYSKTAAASH
jgi:hypothetical protein